jgi:hypothetical protein
MNRKMRFTLWMSLALVAFPGGARAYQPEWVEYYSWAWPGWSGTVQGDIARGLGYFYIGAGIYNRETAIAWSIDTDTMIRWNQYVYLSQQEATRLYFARRNAAIAKDRSLYDALMKRIQDDPTAFDVTNGDALNAALDQLSDPRVHASALRMADSPIYARLVQDIPFRNAAEAVTFSLSQLRASTEWPAVLLDLRFAADRAEFVELVERARQDSLDDGQVSPETRKSLRAVADRLKEKLMDMPLEDQAENAEALKFVNTVVALTRMLEKPEIEQVIDELKKIQKTTVSNLLAFMHAYNLRFAPATTPRQREVYTELYTILDQTRDRILGEAKLDNTVTGRASKATPRDVFSAMDFDRIEGRKKQAPTQQP